MEEDVFFFLSGVVVVRVVVWADREHPLLVDLFNQGQTTAVERSLVVFWQLFVSASDLVGGRLVDWPKCGGVARPNQF